MGASHKYVAKNIEFPLHLYIILPEGIVGLAGLGRVCHPGRMDARQDFCISQPKQYQHLKSLCLGYMNSFYLMVISHPPTSKIN